MECLSGQNFDLKMTVSCFGADAALYQYAFLEGSLG